MRGSNSSKMANPMENELVLGKIFQFCEVSSLKNIRLVSSKWRDLSLNAWRRKSMLQLPCHYINEFLKLIDSQNDGDPLNLRQHPFKRYSVKFKDTGEGRDRDDQLYDLQKRVALEISHLRPLHLRIVWDSEYFRGFREYLQSILNSNSVKCLDVTWGTLVSNAVWDSREPLRSSSSVKRLNLFTRRAKGYHIPEVNFWEYLLRSFPQVEALSVGVENEDSQAQFHLREKEGIAMLLKHHRIPLRELEMMKMYVSENEVTEYVIPQYTLAECKFPLERLSYHVAWNREGEIPILQLLKSCKATLQNFETAISFGDCRMRITGRQTLVLEPISLSEPVSMEVLKELRIVNKDGLKWAMFFMAQLELPALEKVVVKHDADLTPYIRNPNYGKVSVSIPYWKRFERLHTVELHDCLHIPEPEMIEKFAKMMPNLAHLAIALDKNTFPLICHHFKGLKTLNVVAAVNEAVDIDDESLTGLSKAQLEEGEIQVGSRAHNITDLECLTDFRIDCEEQLRWDGVKLTDHSVIYGFLQLPRLYNLSIAIDELSGGTKEKLLNHVKGNVDLQVKPEPFRNLLGMHDNLENQEWSEDCHEETYSD